MYVMDSAVPCIVRWGQIMGLTGVIFVVLNARGVVTRGVA